MESALLGGKLNIEGFSASFEAAHFSVLYCTLNHSSCSSLNTESDFPAYIGTGYSDTPLTVTILTVPKWPNIYKR